MELEVTEYGLKIFDSSGDCLAIGLSGINFLLENLPSCKIKIQEKITVLEKNIQTIQTHIKNLKE